MTNGIKEILDNIKNIIEENGKRGCNSIMLLSSIMEQLLDYITNLQEEKQRLLESADCLSKGYSDLEQRIDKAVEYILENVCCDTRVYTRCENVYKVVDILRGDE